MFESWNDYFFMLGSSAAALIGLMFVVVTLTAGRDREQTEGAKKLYTSPVVWNLAVVLVMSGATMAPTMTTRWFGAFGLGLALLGVGMGIRNAIGIQRIHMTGEDTAFDVWWYGIVPAVVYGALGAASAGIFAEQPWAPSAVAATLMALLLVSIHAEWDLVTFLAPLAASPPDPSKHAQDD